MLLASVPLDRRPARAMRLLSGLGLYGISDAMLVLAGLGLDPWDVLHQGLTRTFGLQVGTWSIIVGAAVLLGWLPLRQRPGVGTVCNVVIIGAVIDLFWHFRRSRPGCRCGSPSCSPLLCSTGWPPGSTSAPASVPVRAMA